MFCVVPKFPRKLIGQKYLGNANFGTYEVKIFVIYRSLYNLVTVEDIEADITQCWIGDIRFLPYSLLCTGDTLC